MRLLCGVCLCVPSRYDHLEAKTKAQSEIQQGSIDQLEEYNSRIRDLRRALQVGGLAMVYMWGGTDAMRDLASA